MKIRKAVVYSDNSSVAAYLPSRYAVTDVRDGKTYIEGQDFHGWTLDGFIIPRLLSGNMLCDEIDAE